MDRAKTLIIIPAYNEAANIHGVVQSLQQEKVEFDIVVINDGSTDETGKIVSQIQTATSINLPLNLGIGGAVQTGFKYAKGRGYTIAVQFDGDGQHNADEIQKLIHPIQQDVADVVIGSRFTNPRNNFQSSLFRRIGIKVFYAVNSLLIKQRITDNTSGFRAYNRKAIEFLADHYPTDYPEPEAVILLAKNRFRLAEVGVLMNDRIAGKSSIGGLQCVYYMVKVLLAICMNALRPKII